MSDFVVIGIDPSSRKIAVTVTRNHEPAIRMQTKTLPKDIADVCLVSFTYVRWMTKEYVDAGDQVYVFIEEPVVGRGGVYTTLRQAKAHGAMVAGAKSVPGANIHTVNNQRWKKVVLGNGSLGKPEIKRRMYEVWRDAYDASQGDQDLIDSAAINRYGLHVVRLKQKVARTTKFKPVRKRRPVGAR